MELIFTQSSSRTWLVYDEGTYTLDLSRTRMRTWQDHLLENIKVFKDDTGSYTITADEVHFKYICDFTAKIHNVDQFELPQDNIWEEPETKGFWFFKRLTGKTIHVGVGYGRLKERTKFCLRTDHFSILGQNYCEQNGVR